MGESLKAIILGIIQGLTEFLPVSSSGHLEIAKFILGDDAMPAESMLMTVVLHFATALATVVVFRKQIMEIISGLFQKSMNEEKLFAIKIIISMIPAAIVGLVFEKQIEALFSQNLILVCLMLIVTAVLLFFSSQKKTHTAPVTYSNALVIGIAQAVAILPGISRSGATISTALMLGIARDKAAPFSFLMVVPLIFGKMAKDLLDGALSSTSSESLSTLGLGFAAAFISGFFACTWMIQIVQKSKLHYFGIYCLIIAAIGLIYVFTR